MPDPIEDVEVDDTTDNSQGNKGIALAQERERRRDAEESLKAERQRIADLEAELASKVSSQENNNNVQDQPEDLRPLAEQ